MYLVDCGDEGIVDVDEIPCEPEGVGDDESMLIYEQEQERTKAKQKRADRRVAYTSRFKDGKIIYEAVQY